MAASCTPLITIIVNNYNYGRFLDDAILSCLNQTYAAKEIIVVDDGSTDNSREIIEKYGDKIIRIFKENGGQGSAINAGFRQSHGDLLLFLDADDMLAPDVLEEIARKWNGKATKLHFRLHVVDGSGTVIGHNPACDVALPEGDLQSEVIHVGHYVTPPSTGNVYSRQFIAATYPIPEEPFRRGADSYHFIQAPLYGEIQALPKIGGKYRMHGANGFLKKRRDSSREDLLGILQRHDRCLELIQNFVSAHGLKNTYSPKYYPDINFTRMLFLRVENKLDFPMTLQFVRDILYGIFANKSFRLKRRPLWILKTLFVAFAPLSLVWKAYPNICPGAEIASAKKPDRTMTAPN